MSIFELPARQGFECHDLQASLMRCRDGLAETQNQEARKIYEALIARYEAKLAAFAEPRNPTVPNRAKNRPLKLP
jgi:hypothetical protein